MRPSALFCCNSSNRTGVKDATNTTPHGNQRLHVQWLKAPDDGHSSIRNIYNNVECNKKFYDYKTDVHLVGFYSILRYMFLVNFLCCQVEVSQMGRSLVQRIPTDAANRVYFSSFFFCSTCFGRYIHPSSGASTIQAGMV
jgi:hypothetical protein